MWFYFRHFEKNDLYRIKVVSLYKLGVLNLQAEFDGDTLAPLM